MQWQTEKRVLERSAFQSGGTLKSNETHACMYIHYIYDILLIHYKYIHDIA